MKSTLLILLFLFGQATFASSKTAAFDELAKLLQNKAKQFSYTPLKKDLQAASFGYKSIAENTRDSFLFGLKTRSGAIVVASRIKLPSGETHRFTFQFYKKTANQGLSSERISLLVIGLLEDQGLDMVAHQNGQSARHMTTWGPHLNKNRLMNSLVTSKPFKRVGPNEEDLLVQEVSLIGDNLLENLDLEFMERLVAEIGHL